MIITLDSQVFIEKDKDEKADPVTSSPWTAMNKDEAIECIALDKSNSRVDTYYIE